MSNTLISSPSKNKADTELLNVLDCQNLLPPSDLGVRGSYLSGLFLGRPYLLGALGEGAEGEFDQNPLYRTDGFDCLTYVNTVLGLLFAQSFKEFLYHLSRINYRNGIIAYQNRHHFMSVDWNPANIINGYIRDLTLEIVDKTGYAVAYAYIDRPNWFRYRTSADLKFPFLLSEKELEMKLHNLRSYAQKCQAQHAYTPYIPFNRLFNFSGEINTPILQQFPEFALLEIVRPNWDLAEKIGTRLNISHLGFFINRNGEFIFRHASQIKKAVVDEPLIAYLQRCMRDKTIQGISVFEILA